MALKLIQTSPYEAKNQTELSLRQAFEFLEPRLRPPFPLTIPNPQEYLLLNQAILYGVLGEPHFAKTHIKHLHAIVTDGYYSFVNLIIKVVKELYIKLIDTVKIQLIWVTKEMIDVSAIGVSDLLVFLLRQIIGGDFSDDNLWLCFEVVSIFWAKWDCLLEVEPMILTSALYTYLRLLSDHCRLLDNKRLDALRQLEIKFCVRVLKEQFHLCLKIGRDLIRLLQDLVHVPEFRALWKDLVFNPNEFRTPGFSDISQIYCKRTSSRYFLLRITPEIEAQLRFLLTHVKLGSQKRHQAWFSKKFLCVPERETLIEDIVRFICCCHHPPNEIIQSEVIPRWAVLGWLVKSCTKNFIEAKVKLALFYDWLFFDEKIDNIMNIEPAMLLMVHSMSRYIDMTHNLLEFLFLLVDNYDVERKHLLVKGVSLSFNILVQRGVIPSLDVMISCHALSPFLKERLGNFLSGLKVEVSKELRPLHHPHQFVAPLSLQTLSSCTETSTLSHKGQQPTCIIVDGSAKKSFGAASLISDGLDASCSPLVVTAENPFDALENVVRCFREAVKKSTTIGLMALKELLLLVNVEDQRATRGSSFPDVLSSNIAEVYESNGYKLFAPLESHHNQDYDDETESPTSVIIRSFMFAQHQRMLEMLLFWSRNGSPVGARLLSYASRLSYEAEMAGCILDDTVASKSINRSDSSMPLLAFHANEYHTFLNNRREDSHENQSCPKMDNKIISKLVVGAFAAYRCFLVHLRNILLKDSDISLPKLLFSDLLLCSGWESKRLKNLFCSVFWHLSDLSAGDENFVRLLVDKLDNNALVGMHFQLGLKRFSMFGESSETISNLIKNSLSWDCLEQHKFWGLIRSELAVSNVQVEKVVLNFFSGELDANLSSTAVGGLLSLCSCRAPTPELVGTVMLLPNNAFQDFAATVLSTWVVSYSSKLFDSLAEFAEKLGKTGEFVISSSGGIMINHSAIVWLLDYFNAQGMDSADILSNFSVNLTCKKEMQQL